MYKGIFTTHLPASIEPALEGFIARVLNAINQPELTPPSYVTSLTEVLEQIYSFAELFKGETHQFAIFTDMEGSLSQHRTLLASLPHNVHVKIVITSLEGARNLMKVLDLQSDQLLFVPVALDEATRPALNQILIDARRGGGNSLN